MFNQRSKTLIALAFLLLANVPFGNVFAAVAQDEMSTEAPGDSNVLDAKFAAWNVMGPDGGDVRVVEIDPRDKNRIYISTLDGQIYTSGDGGTSWRLLVNFNRPDLILDQLLVDSRDSKVLYASGHRGQGPGGFWRSTDGGTTWKESKEVKNEAIHAMTQSTADPNILLLGSVAGVWISKNSGEDWQRMSSPTVPVNVDSLATDPRTTNTIYAGTWWRPYKTTDGGKTWRLIKDGMIDDSDVFAVTVDPRNPDHIVASACSGIYESMNAGELWSKLQGIPSQSRRTRDIVQHPSMAGTIYAATTEGFWMTNNAGKTWAMTTQRNLEINSIAVHPDDPNRVFLGTNNYGVLVSRDGGRNFAPTNGSFTSRMTYFITPDIQQPSRLYAASHNTATGGGFVFVSNDGGRSWQPTRNLDFARVRAFVVHQDAVTPNLMYLGTNVGMFKSIDRGNSWTFMAPPPVAKKGTVKRAPAKTTAKAPVKKTGSSKAVAVAPPAPALVPAITDTVRVIESIPGTSGLLVGTERGLYRAVDPLKGWERIDFGPGLSTNVFAVHVSPTRPDTMWVGTGNSGVIVSRDNGHTWTKTPGAVDNVPVSSIVTDPKRPDYVYVGTTQAFYMSRDGGKSWSRRAVGSGVGNFTSILINPSNTDEILISNALDTEGGIYISTDAGTRWKRVDSKELHLPSSRFWALAFDPQDPNRIYAATHSSGVYRIERERTAVGGM